VALINEISEGVFLLISFDGLDFIGIIEQLELFTV
jgi:hypothetical protein